MIQLRPKQAAGIASIRQSYAMGHRSILFVAPTGFGKTVVFSYIAQHAKGNVLIIAHRGELIDQISTALTAFNVKHGFITAGHKSAQQQVMVASQQTLVRRVENMRWAPALIIIDEAHHATANNTLGKILKAFPSSKVLGVTATPCRLSGEGLGDIFQTMILGPSTADTIADGHLTPARIFAPPTVDTSGLRKLGGDYKSNETVALMDKPTITGDAITHYQKHANGLPFVAFCTSIDHANHVAEGFRAAGVGAVCIHGQLSDDIRRSMVSDFRAGKITGLCSVDLISEGFDCPGIVCGIMLRPTASRGLHLQQIGRCLRLSEGKTHAVILDHVGNCGRHGLPTEDQHWTLEGTVKKKKAKPEIPSPRVCPQCWAAMPSASKVCSECNYEWPIESRTVEQVEGELVEWVAPKQPSPAKMEEWACRTEQDWIDLATRRGYKSPIYWASMRYKLRQQRNAN